MLGGMRKWVAFTQKATHRVSGGQSTVDGTSLAKKDDENPWFSLSSPARSTPTPSRTQSEKSPIVPYDEMPKSQTAPSRWLGEDTSQDSAYGRTPMWGNSEQKIADSRKFELESGLGMKQDMPATARRLNGKARDTKSVFFMQSLLAGALVLGGLYIHQTNQPFAKTVNNFASGILQTDYSNRITPVVAKALDRFHVTIPTFGVHAAVYLHVPLAGKIDADYSATHPEVWIQGKPNEPVLAAGSGIVTLVENNGQSVKVEIDHGAIGTSVYTGLGTVTVRVNEYVDSGQVIGKMPQGTKIEDLHFSLTKSGKFENPHDYIHFSATGGQ